MNEKEQAAFKTGDCEELLSLMDDAITFFLNGRKVPSKDIFLNFCQKIPRPFAEPTTSDTKIHPLTENSGYVVKTMEFQVEGKVDKKEVVTKIWKKDEGGWKMVHLHSTGIDVAKIN